MNLCDHDQVTPMCDHWKLDECPFVALTSDWRVCEEVVKHCCHVPRDSTRDLYLTRDCFVMTAFGDWEGLLSGAQMSMTQVGPAFARPVDAF